jgi:hypothetical protein
MANPIPPQTTRWHRLRPHTGRGISSVAAIAAALGLLWFMVIRADWNPALGAATEWFWVRVVVGMMLYAAVQQITLSYETGRGDELAATIDLLAALLPCLVVVGAELFWLGKESVVYLSWRHHVIGLLWALYSVVDFFATNITNQRLRALQFAPPRSS